MSDNIALGAFGEDQAKLFLGRKGYQILERNIRTKKGEIDLIAKKENEIIGVEVKTRTSHDFGFPEEAVDRKKIRKILSVLSSYVQIKKYSGYTRIDIIAITVIKESKKIKIHHIKNIDAS